MVKRIESETMKQIIRKIIKNNRKIDYIQRCVRHFSDENFVKTVLDIEKNPLLIKICECGDKNPGKLIYIAQTMGCDGFFAELRFILHEIYFAECFGMTPVALIPKESCYYENKPINGKTNPFEYYFEPVSEINVDDARHSRAVVKHNYYQRNYINSVFDMNSGYLPSEEYMKEMARIVNKYLHLNEFSGSKIKRDCCKVLGKERTLGVHVRGADFKRHYINHPNIVTIKEYIEATSQAMQREKFDKIFLATDDLSALSEYKKVFGDKVVFYSDVIRTNGDETVMKSTDDRENHHYLLGLEVLRDMYTLSECSGIIAGLSNVSIFARIYKLSQNNDFVVMNYLNKGIKNA